MQLLDYHLGTVHGSGKVRFYCPYTSAKRGYLIDFVVSEDSAAGIKSQHTKNKLRKRGGFVYSPVLVDQERPIQEVSICSMLMVSQDPNPRGRKMSQTQYTDRHKAH